MDGVVGKVGGYFGVVVRHAYGSESLSMCDGFVLWRLNSVKGDSVQGRFCCIKRIVKIRNQ